MRYVLIKEQSQITEIIPFYDPGLQRVLAYAPHPGYTGFYWPHAGARVVAFDGSWASQT